MRFAFYGRVSTEDQQDPKASRNWQITRARQLIEPSGGEIVAEFFDIGQSRSLPWSRRPEAAKLLEALGSSDRNFDAVVIGEPQRAFYGNQFGLTFPVFVHYSVELWVPEVGGAIDPGSDAHEIVMSLYGGMSKGERNRIKTRVRSAMAAQAAITREDWEAVQAQFRSNKRRYTRTPKDGRHYVLAGRLSCGQCGRRMEGTWNHDRPYYRCQIHRDDPVNPRDHPATIYVREDSIVPHLDSWVGELFTDEYLDDTCAKLAAAAQPDTDQQAQTRQIRERIRKLDQELDSYRAIVRTEPEAASAVGKWIAETNQERRRLEALLGRTPTTRLTADDVKALVASLQDITATLAATDPADKAKVYAEMGIDITYHQDGRVVVESRPRVVESGVGERTRTSTS